MSIGLMMNMTIGLMSMTIGMMTSMTKAREDKNEREWGRKLKIERLGLTSVMHRLLFTPQV